MAKRLGLQEFQQNLLTRLQEAAATTAIASVLGFQSGSNYWLVEMSELKELLPVGKIKPVPHAQSWYRGLTNVRGNLISVIDFAAWQEQPLTPSDSNNRILILSQRFAVDAALLVNRVVGLRVLHELRHQAHGAAESPWIGAGYEDNQYQWRKLELSALVQQAEFLNVGV